MTTVGETISTTSRLRKLEAELKSLNVSNSNLLDEGKSPSQWELKTALLLGVKTDYYKMALEDLRPVLEAARQIEGCPIGSLQKHLNELRAALAEVENA